MASWRAGPVGAAGGRWRAGGLVVALASVVGLGGWVGSWLRPAAPAAVLVYAADYADNLAVPPYPAAGWQTPLGRTNSTSPKPFTRETAARLPAELRATAGPSLVLVLAAHGGAGPEGPFLLPDDATSDPADRLPLRTVLTALGDLPAGRPKLLILDAAVADGYPELGLATNGFAAGVAALADDIAAVPNLTVLMSSGSGERSWDSPEWRSTAFARFVRVGLDGSADTDGDRRVSVAELATFVTTKTADWARGHRRARQMVTRLPADRTFHLTATGPPPPTEPPPAFVPPPELAAAWSEWNLLAVADPPPGLYSPRAWAAYTARLHRFEYHLARGDPAADRDRAELARLKADIEQARRLPLTARSQTFAVGSGLGGLPDGPDQSAAVATLATTPANQRAAKWAELAKGADPVGVRLAFGRAVVVWAADRPDRLTTAAELATLAAEGLAVRPAEVQFLQAVAARGGREPATSDWHPAARDVLLTRLAAERAATPHRGELAGPWAVAAVTRGDAKRRPAEDLLFSDAPADWTEARSGAVAARAEFETATAAARSAATAADAVARAGDLLAGLEPWLAAPPTDPRAGESDLAGLRRLRAAAHALSAAGSTPDAELPPIDVPATELRERYAAAVRQSLACRPPADDPLAMTAWWRAAEPLVAAAPPPELAAARSELATDYYRVSRQLHVLAASGPLPGDLPDPAADRAATVERGRRLGRLLVARLPGGLPDADFRYDQAARRPDPLGELTAADTAVAAAFAGLGSPADPVLADRLARVTRTGADWDRAARRLRAVRAGVALVAQARRVNADRWWDDGPPRPYFRPAALVLLADARRLGADATAAAAEVAADDPFPVAAKLVGDATRTDEPNPTAAVGFDAPPTPHTGPGLAVVRAAQAAWGRATDTRVSLSLMPAAGAEALPVAGFFRGRTARWPLAVTRVPTPTVTLARTRPPAAATVSVVADPDVADELSAGGGAVAVVVDATGSMGPDDDKPGRFPEAVAALDTLLAGLPRGMLVRVTVIGHQGSPADGDEVRPLSPWQPADRAAAVARVRAVRPWGESPLVRVAVRAKVGLTAADGPNAVVLISDALDNPGSGAKKTPVKDGLRAFDGSGVALHVLALPVGPKEQAGQDEFRAVTTFRPAGRFLPASAAAGLAAALRRASNLQVLLTLTPAAGGRPVRVPATADGADVPLAAGRYQPDLGGRPFDLRPGERLDAELFRGAGGWQVGRRRSPPAAALANPTAPGWTFAAVRLTDGLRLTFADPLPATDPLRPARVADLWLEPDGPGGPLAGTADPAGVRLAAGPSAVRAWWQAAAPFPAVGTVGTSGGEVGGVRVRPAAVERHTVVDGTRDCLAVRLDHPVDKPAWVRPTGWTPDGSAVRLFPCGRTTCLFWWDGPPPAGLTFELVRGEDAKAAADRDGLSATLTMPPEYGR